MSDSAYSTVEAWKLLWYERAVNAATYLGAMTYGLHIAVCFTAVAAIFRDKERRSWIWLPFVATLFALGTVNISCSIHFNQLAWIDERNYPGGPVAFLLEQQAKAPNVVAIVTSVIILLLVDAFLILRCHTLWKKIYVTAFLSVVLGASTVISILHINQVFRSTQLSDDSDLSFSLPYASLAASLNIIITLVLFSRLIDLRRRLSSNLSVTAREAYSSIWALVIESALPTGIFSFIFVVQYGVHSSGAVLVFPLLVQTMAIMPELIVLRISNRQAWSPESIRAPVPPPVTLRDRLGRSTADTAGHEVSMVTLNDNGSKDSVILKTGRDFP